MVQFLCEFQQKVSVQVWSQELRLKSLCLTLCVGMYKYIQQVHVEYITYPNLVS
jgi:hypothetical protein